jgi:hypothetical protein
METQTFAFEGEDSEKAKKKLIEHVVTFNTLNVNICWINYTTETRGTRYVAKAEICFVKKARNTKRFLLISLPSQRN